MKKDLTKKQLITEEIKTFVLNIVKKYNFGIHSCEISGNLLKIYMDIQNRKKFPDLIINDLSKKFECCIGNVPRSSSPGITIRVSNFKFHILTKPGTEKSRPRGEFNEKLLENIINEFSSKKTISIVNLVSPSKTITLSNVINASADIAKQHNLDGMILDKADVIINKVNQDPFSISIKKEDAEFWQSGDKFLNVVGKKIFDEINTTKRFGIKVNNKTNSTTFYEENSEINGFLFPIFKTDDSEELIKLILFGRDIRKNKGCIVFKDFNTPPPHEFDKNNNTLNIYHKRIMDRMSDLSDDDFPIYFKIGKSLGRAKTSFLPQTRAQFVGRSYYVGGSKTKYRVISQSILNITDLYRKNFQ